MLCSAFKGILPSDLFDKYDCRGGWFKLEYDIAIAGEMSDRIGEQMDEKKDAKAMVARRNQRRELITSKDMGSIMQDWVDS